MGLGPLDGAEWGGRGKKKLKKKIIKRTAAVSLPFREPEMNTLLMRTWPLSFFKKKNFFFFFFTKMYLIFVMK